MEYIAKANCGVSTDGSRRVIEIVFLEASITVRRECVSGKQWTLLSSL